ncbi:MAG TPA: molybdopterin molybdotransferase MoeA [Methylophilus sp.]|nr:molybdopterin molybdotransferase MoeA [Methylophilus sp.]HQQ34086.1 molybdopterin molybdotransferase MoeA [Methylophilus sp.]
MTKPTLYQIAADPSCMDDYDPNAMSVNQARAFIAQFLQPVAETETLPIRTSLNRVLAENIVSPCNVPAHDNSAMDGIAFRFEDAKQPLTLIGTAFAGRPFAQKLGVGECVKIMTGAVIPQGADTVEMQERVTWQGETVTLQQMPKQGQHIRRAGEDLANGQTALRKGTSMKPADIGLLASLGIAQVQVFRKLKVAFFSTGDELVSVGEKLAEGQIYDSNRYTLYGMLTRLGAEISDLGNVPDDPVYLETTLLQAAQNNDVVITSGGVSVGEADYMKALLAKHGQVLFWKINMKPGRPLAYGKVAKSHYFGLPGNPVSAMVTFYQFVQPALQTLSGALVEPIPLLKAVCVEPIKKATGRVEFQRGILFQIESGEWLVKPTGNQGSGILNSMSAANCFIVLDEATGNCAPGQMVNVQLLHGIV